MRARVALRRVFGLALCFVPALSAQGQAGGPDDARVIELRVRWACAMAEQVNGTCPENEVPDRLEGWRKWRLGFGVQSVVLWPGERVLLRVHPLPGLDTTLTLLGPGNARIGKAAQCDNLTGAFDPAPVPSRHRDDARDPILAAHTHVPKPAGPCVASGMWHPHEFRAVRLKHPEVL